MKPHPLYDEALLERARRPVGSGTLAPPCTTATASNPLCGDTIEVDVRAVDGRIEGLAHRSRGCALVAASASLLAETSTAGSAADALARASALRDWLSGSGALPRELGPLEAVHVFPSRRRCVLLPWDAFFLALAPDERA